jgi:hypothetical protein
MLVVYKLKIFLMGSIHPVSDSVLNTFNTTLTLSFKKTRCQPTRTGPTSLRDEVREAV